MLRLHTLGELSVCRAGESAPIKTVQKRSLMLLAILASSRNARISRERIINILWPESNPESSRASLRQAVFATRRELGTDDVILGSTELLLNAAVITSDLKEFCFAVGEGDFHRAVELYVGPFLDGIQARSSQGFEGWAETQRKLYADEYRHALERLAGSADSEGESIKAVGLWRKLVTEDPLSSRYAVGLMESLIAAGDSAAALAHFRLYESLIKEELSALPDPAVALIARRVQDGEGSVLRSVFLRTGHSDFVIPPTGREAPPAETAKPVRSGVMITAAIAVVLALGTLAFAARSHVRPDGTRRLVIAPFENNTGNRQLDAIGAMISGRIAEELARTGQISVIDPATAFFAARDAKELAGSVSGHPASVRAISRATDADLVTTGEYFRKGDSLQFHARVSDARSNRVIASIQPVTVLAAATAEAVETVRQRVLGILAREVDPRLSEVIEEQAFPPTFDAYRAYTSGLDLFSRHDYPSAAVQFRRAYQIDTSFTAALIWAVHAYGNGSDLARSLLDTLYVRRGGLSPLDRYGVDALRAHYAGKIDSSITAARTAGGIAPRSQWNWNAALWALSANRPREAITLLEHLDPMRGWLKGSPDYWAQLSAAQHAVGDHDEERETNESGLRVFPADKRLLRSKVRSLAAQGRIQELNSGVSEMLATSEEFHVPGRLAIFVFELRAHGYAADANALLTRSLPYYAARWAGTRDGRLEFAELLFQGQRWREARSQFRLAAHDTPESLWIFGSLGICAAILGESTEAVAIADSLGRITGEARPTAVFLRASVLARLRRRAEAVAMLRQSYALGYPKMSRFIGHSDRHFFPDLWGYPPFEEFYKSD